MKKKPLFVIGDSISMHYGPYLKEMLKDKCGYSRIKGNGEDSINVLKFVQNNKNKLLRHDIILFNCGLHDIKLNKGKTEKQVPIKQYEKNLKEILSELKKAGIVIWVRITPVDDKRHNRIVKDFSRFNKDVLTYNRVADKVMAENKIQTIDLYKFTKNLGNNLFCDHVHFKSEIRKLQAAYIAGRIGKIL
ncbi:MAG: hypothetical protein A2252_11820 [Elusimicrobia bacterium RIFOXYA2_FULL_39_19]|nr:MAG: hypothetical protein A2252_11820 [Elusimicrobia bacterium RIFOXYA2_FULL_39_19]